MAEGGNDIEAPPSNNNQVHYLYAFKNGQPIIGINYGVFDGFWMILRPINEIDQAWELIKAATEAGRLGLGSSVRTVKFLEGERVYENKLISVFSYGQDQDTNTEQDKLKALRELGFNVWELRRKPITSRGHYFHQGDRDFCERSNDFPEGKNNISCSQNCSKNCILH